MDLIKLGKNGDFETIDNIFQTGARNLMVRNSLQLKFNTDGADLIYFIKNKLNFHSEALKNYLMQYLYLRNYPIENIALTPKSNGNINISLSIFGKKQIQKVSIK